VVVNFLEKEVSIIGSEIFMNPAASEELTFGYFVSKDLDLLHVDFGIRYDHINRQGSINHQEEHEDEDAGEVEQVDQDRNNLSFAFSLGRDISETLELTLGYAQVERAPSVVEMSMNGPHLATGRFEEGNDQLKNRKTSICG
jgi:iron complex outermembrane receptor protein